MRWIAIILLACFSPVVYAGTQTAVSERQSFESCGLITSEYLTVLQLTSRGFGADALKESLTGISDQARKRVDALIKLSQRDGLIDTYSTINSEYARCAKGVYDNQGLPPRGSREAKFHQCAGENKVGYEILLAALVGANPNEVIGQLDPRHIPLAETLFAVYRVEGALPAFDGLASELKHCLRTP